MSNYFPKPIEGLVKQYKRAYNVVISNRLSGAPNISFLEEIITSLPDGIIVRNPEGSLSFDVNELDEEFDIIDFKTNTVTGTMTYREISAALTSLYVTKALQRDNEKSLPK